MFRELLLSYSGVSICQEGKKRIFAISRKLLCGRDLRCVLVFLFPQKSRHFALRDSAGRAEFHRIEPAFANKLAHATWRNAKALGYFADRVESFEFEYHHVSIVAQMLVLVHKKGQVLAGPPARKPPALAEPGTCQAGAEGIRTPDL